MEKRYDHRFKVVFDAIMQLISPLPLRRKIVGFEVADKRIKK
jgi:hypothetical protein